MDRFTYRDGQLFGEDVNLDTLAAEYGTPLYVYSQQTLEHHYDALTEAFAELKPLICYSIKSCGNVNLVKVLADRGSGMDVVSGGELFRAIKAGVNPAKIVYAGVGKTDDEIKYALNQGLGTFNIESEAEFENIAHIAKKMQATANAALRVNPDVDPRTHAKTTTGKKESKFGVDIERAKRFFERYGRDGHLKLNAIHLHIGSPVYSAQPYVDAITKTLTLVDELRGMGYEINTLDIGGGFGADYVSDQTPPYTAYAEMLVPLLKPFVEAGGNIILEPGRTIAANAGILLTRVQYIKTRRQEKIRHHRQRHASPDPPDAIRIVPLYLADQCRARCTCPPRGWSRCPTRASSRPTSSARSARPETASPRTAPCPRWRAATWSPSSAPARTAWSWLATTTPCPAPPRSCSAAARHT